MWRHNQLTLWFLVARQWIKSNVEDLKQRVRHPFSPSTLFLRLQNSCSKHTSLCWRRAATSSTRCSPRKRSSKPPSATLSCRASQVRSATQRLIILKSISDILYKGRFLNDARSLSEQLYHLWVCLICGNRDARALSEVIAWRFGQIFVISNELFTIFGHFKRAFRQQRRPWASSSTTSTRRGCRWAGAPRACRRLSLPPSAWRSRALSPFAKCWKKPSPPIKIWPVSHVTSFTCFLLFSCCDAPWVDVLHFLLGKDFASCSLIRMLRGACQGAVCGQFLVRDRQQWRSLVRVWGSWGDLRLGCGVWGDKASGMGRMNKSYFTASALQYGPIVTAHRLVTSLTSNSFISHARKAWRVNKVLLSEVLRYFTELRSKNL